MINSITQNYGTHQWMSTQPSPSTTDNKVADWGVSAKKTEEASTKRTVETTPIATKPPESKLNLLGYNGLLGNNTLGTSFTQPLAFNPPKLNTPQAIDTWNTIQANAFMPANPNDILNPQTTSFNTTPNLGNGSLGTNLLTGLFSKLT